MSEYRFRCSGLIPFLLVLLTVASCSKETTLSTPDFPGRIQIVITSADGTVDGPPGVTEALSEEKIVREDSGPITARSQENRITLDQFDGDVFVRVYSQNLVRVTSQQLTCSEQGGVTECSGTVTVPFGNYQVAVEAIDNDEVQYFGIDTNVDVVEGITAVATITMIDFTTSFTTMNYLQTGPFTLAWSSVDSANAYLVEEDTTSTFATAAEVYRNSATNTTISKMENDIFYYRVSPLRNSISTGRPGSTNPVLVIVDDHILSIGTGSGGPGSSNNRVPVTVVNSDSAIAALQFDLVYEPSLITPSGTACETATRVENIGGTVACNGEVEPGLARYVFYFYDGPGLNLLPPGVDPVFYIHSDVPGTARTGTDTLRLENVNITDADGVGQTGYRTYNGSFEIR